MNTTILLLKNKAEALLEQYRSFSRGLSGYNMASKLSFMEKQPQFESQARTLNASFHLINPKALSPEELKQYEELKEVMSDIIDEIF